MLNEMPAFAVSSCFQSFQAFSGSVSMTAFFGARSFAIVFSVASGPPKFVLVSSSAAVDVVRIMNDSVISNSVGKQSYLILIPSVWSCYPKSGQG